MPFATSSVADSNSLSTGEALGLVEAEGERRHLTVLCCGLVEDPALLILDEEDLSIVMSLYHAAFGSTVRRHGGWVPEEYGMSLFAYFGYPTALEEAPLRAIRAGLDVLRALPGLEAKIRERLPSTRLRPLRAKLAAHSGSVVIRKTGRETETGPVAYGRTPSLSVLLQQLAPDGGLILSKATRDLIDGSFLLEDLGSRFLRETGEEVQIWSVVDESPTPDRLRRSLGRGLSAFVGRDSELADLMKRWSVARDGRGQVVLLAGEPGIGKSRLLRLTRERLSRHPHLWVELRCSAFHRESAFYPVIDLLERTLFFSAGDTPEQKLGRLARQIEELARDGVELGNAQALLASLLGLTPADDAAAPVGESDTRRAQTLQALRSWLFSLASREPLVLVGEDLHWCDPSTLELLATVVEACPSYSMLLLLTLRPEQFEPGFPLPSESLRIGMIPLDRDESRTLANAVAGEVLLSPAALETVLDRAEGNPLFVEELVKAELDASTGSPRTETTERTPSTGDASFGAEVPPQIQDALLARLDRLGPARLVAQLASVLGRYFPRSLVEEMAGLDPASLDEALMRLERAELVLRRGEGPAAEYSFKHSLIRDVAYHSLLKTRRRELHARAAEVLARSGTARPEVLAFHYDEAALPDRAADRWFEAGQAALARSAYAEATIHLEKCLNALAELEQTPALVERRIDTLLYLGLGYFVRNGMSSMAFQGPNLRALGLIEELARDDPGALDSPRHFMALWSMQSWHLARGEYDSAIAFAERMRAVSERLAGHFLLAEIYPALGQPYLWKGDLARAREYLEGALRLDQERPFRAPYLHATDDPTSWAQPIVAWFDWFDGRPRSAFERSEEAVTRAGQSIVRPRGKVHALLQAGWLYFLAREVQPTRSKAEEALGICRIYGLADQALMAEMLRGWALTLQGEETEGATLLEHGREGLLAMRLEVGGVGRLIVNADALLTIGERSRARDRIFEARRLLDRSGEWMFASELSRLEAALVLADGGQREEAEAKLLEAIDQARRVGNLPFELRAACDLAELWGPSRQPEARRLLRPLLDRFETDLEVFDLSRAGRLVAELAAQT